MEYIIIFTILAFVVFVYGFSLYINLVEAQYIEWQGGIIGFVIGFIIGWILQRNYISTAPYNMSFFVVEGTPALTSFIIPVLSGVLLGVLFYLFCCLPFIQNINIERERKEKERHKIITKYLQGRIDEEVLNSKWYKKEMKREARQKRKEEKKDNYWNEPWP